MKQQWTLTLTQSLGLCFVRQLQEHRKSAEVVDATFCAIVDILDEDIDGDWVLSHAEHCAELLRCKMLETPGVEASRGTGKGPGLAFESRRDSAVVLTCVRAFAVCRSVQPFFVLSMLVQCLLLFSSS